MKVIAFAASNSKKSINKKLVTYAASLLTGCQIEILDLNDYEMPLFSQDRENELLQSGVGHPQLAKDFLAKIVGCDAIIISFAEHNGSYSAAYKNLFDWCSRIEPKVYQNKAMLLLSTSPGGRGGASVMAQAIQSIPRFAGEVKATYSVPSFFDNFDVEKGEIKDATIKAELESAIRLLTV